MPGHLLACFLMPNHVLLQMYQPALMQWPFQKLLAYHMKKESLLRWQMVYGPLLPPVSFLALSEITRTNTSNTQAVSIMSEDSVSYLTKCITELRQPCPIEEPTNVGTDIWGITANTL